MTDEEFTYLRNVTINARDKLFTQMDKIMPNYYEPEKQKTYLETLKEYQLSFSSRFDDFKDSLSKASEVQLNEMLKSNMDELAKETVRINPKLQDTPEFRQKLEQSLNNYEHQIPGVEKSYGTDRQVPNPNEMTWNDKLAATAYTEDKQLEGVQNNLQQQLGRRATHEEVLAEEQKLAGVTVQAVEKKRMPNSLSEVQTSEDLHLVMSVGKKNINAADENGNTFAHSIQDKQLMEVAHQDYGANIHARNMDGNTPLQTTQSSEVQKYLIQNGSDVHNQNEFGKTPLFHAKDSEVAQSMIDKGANANHQSRSGETALFDQAKAGREDVVSKLIDNQVNVNHQDRRGNTALHMASTSETAQVLLDNGAQQMTNQKNMKPDEMATQKGNTNVVNTIEQHEQNKQSQKQLQNIQRMTQI